MIAFGESDRCRHAQVAEHFGETLDEPCGACDVCAPRAGRRPSVTRGGRAARRRRRHDRQGGRGPRLAARAQEPRGDAARLGLRATVGTPLGVLRRARRRGRRRGDALGAGARVRGCARRDRDPGRLPRAARDPGRDAAVARAGVPTGEATRTSSRACAPGGSSGRARTASPPSSSSTTGRSRSSRRHGPRPRRSSSASTASGRPRSTATATRCSPSSPQPDSGVGPYWIGAESWRLSFAAAKRTPSARRQARERPRERTPTLPG